MQRIILGISAEHDSGAVLIVDGGVLAAVNEERLCRRKLYTGYPERSIECVLRIAGVDRAAVTHTAVSTHMHVPEQAWDWWAKDYRKTILTALLNRPRAKAMMRNGAVLATARAAGRAASFRFRRNLRRRLREQGVPSAVTFCDHHTSHAFGALGTIGPNTIGPNTVGADRTLVVTLDAQGDGCCSLVGWWDEGRFHEWIRVPFFDSPAHYYGYVTHLLGYKQMEHEGKVTGLAAHGDPQRLGPMFESLCAFSPKREHLVNRAGYLLPQIEKLRKAIAGHSPADVAAGVQHQLERAVVAYVEHWVAKCPVLPVRLAVSGGVFANVRLNQKLAELPQVASLVVHQHMGDGGLAFGAAVHADHLAGAGRGWHPPKLDHVFLGPEPTPTEIDEGVRTSGFRVLDTQEPARIVGELLAGGCCGAVCRGRMEYGPRALGHRTILYRADDPSVNDWLNERLARTEFMPFAPMVLAGEESKYFGGDLNVVADALRYMVVAVPTTALCRQSAPAISHVDDTARPQIVGDEEPFCRAVLRHYARHTGTPVLINTSFNRHGEPIVNTADQAVQTARQARLDFLVLGNHVLLNPARRIASDDRTWCQRAGAPPLPGVGDRLDARGRSTVVENPSPIPRGDGEPADCARLKSYGQTAT